MRILVINCGGTSIKYQLLQMGSVPVVEAKGIVENIGSSGTLLRHNTKTGLALEIPITAEEHTAGLAKVLGILLDSEFGVISAYSAIDAVGHRVVQGGEAFRGSFLIDEALMQALVQYTELAPLHNPANIKGIEACQTLMPDKPQVAVFDNALHRDIPDYAYIYGLPYEYYQKYGVRRYGFHGISFQYMTERAAELLQVALKQKRVVSLMLGSGSTVNAMAYGKSIDVSTGLSPTEGLIQSTRSGDVDPAVITYIMRKEGLTLNEMDDILNRKSGWLGISGVSNDLRMVEEAAAQGDYRANLAIKAFAYRARKYIGAYAAAMGGIDLLVFAGGAGENSRLIRERICAGLEFIGIFLDSERNAGLIGEGLISQMHSHPVVVVNTNEELVIARETQALLERDNTSFNSFLAI
ncbi:MAG: acetate/propionate family kinase [Desulfitobacteriaceae bacterium]